jgi:hypothetical protein
MLFLSKGHYELLSGSITSLQLLRFDVSLSTSSSSFPRVCDTKPTDKMCLDSGLWHAGVITLDFCEPVSKKPYKVGKYDVRGTFR